MLQPLRNVCSASCSDHQTRQKSNAHSHSCCSTSCLLDLSGSPQETLHPRNISKLNSRISSDTLTSKSCHSRSKQGREGHDKSLPESAPLGERGPQESGSSRSQHSADAMSVILEQVWRAWSASPGTRRHGPSSHRSSTTVASRLCLGPVVAKPVAKSPHSPPTKDCGFCSCVVAAHRYNFRDVLQTGHSCLQCRR